ncbi:MAG: HlyD family efflux transporter periplasmic adaptor subunit [Faecalibacterium sp.]
MSHLTFWKVLSRAFFVFLFAVVVYLFLQITIITNPSYTYETVIEYSYTDSITAKGYVLFEETFVEGSGNIGYLVEEGDRVSKGQTVAEYYTSDSERTLRLQLEETNAEIALLENSENTAGNLVNNLVTQRNTAVYALLEQLDKGNYDTQDGESSFLLAQNKLQITTGDATDFSQRIDLLTEQSQTFTQALETLVEITAPTNGYFVSKDAAQFLSYTMDDLLAMSIADFADSVGINQQVNTDNIVGKVVSNYTWYFVGVCSIEESSRFTEGSTLTLSFPDKTDTLFPATVVSVEQDQASDLMRVTLVCEYIGADALALGQETAEIIFKTYEGLRVPLAAVRMQAEEVLQPVEEEVGEGADTEEATLVEPVVIGEEYIKGVYVAYNGLAKFRKIEILYQTDEYILVPFTDESDISEVRLYDQVIISGVDLSDGKLL